MCGADVLALTVSISVYINNNTFQDLFILILAMHLETIATNNSNIICKYRNTFLYQVSIYNRRQQK